MIQFLIIIVYLILFVLIMGLIFRKEVKAAFDRDPAAANFFEVVFTYSGLHAIIMYRIAHIMHRLKIPFFPRLISQITKIFTGIEIHPGAKIGNGFFIDHGMGVVIGETTVIDDNVTLYQGVTLGGTGKEKGKRHPNIGKNVVVGAGAKVLGNINIGENSYIGANAVVIRDVPDNSTIVGVPGRIAKQEGRKLDKYLDHTHVADPIKQAIVELHKRIKELEEKK